MKKVIFTAVAAMAMMAFVACNNNSKPDTTDMPVDENKEACEHKCAQGDSTAMCCKAEGMAEEAGCCKKAEGEACCKAEGKGEACCKAEGKECPKANAAE